VPGPDAFSYTQSIHKSALTQVPLVALVLKNWSKDFGQKVGSGEGGGIGNVGGGDFEYKAEVKASPDSLILKLKFYRMANGPLPDDVSYRVDSRGAVTKIS
jgi:hypothetical protein